MKELIFILVLFLTTSCSSILYEKELVIQSIEKSVNKEYKWCYKVSSRNLGSTYLYTNKLYLIGDTIKLVETTHK